ncbi:GDPGP1, partial [Symbiodinium sp. KB8]
QTARNHFLLVPAVKERRPQGTPDSKETLWLSFNSIGAGASVNHLHLQGFCAGACDGSWSFPFEISLSRTRGGPKGWPLVGWVFTWTEEKVLDVDANLAAFRLAEFVHRLVDALQVLDMAHNVLINMGRRQVIVFPRRTLFEQSFDVSQLQVSGHETLGWWVVAKDSSDLEEARALELLAKAALDKRGHQKVLQILEWIGWRLREEAKIDPRGDT